VPTIHGESVALRLLERGGRPVTLDELGLTPLMLEAVERLSQRSHGMLLVTGPTGSGKTTTLYSAIQCRKRSTEKIITVEDPIEYELQGVTQVPVHRGTDVTFASALRSILRQDPDVILIGETRDSETAEIAIQAAMTGHLVLTTLHTNDAIGAIPRLVDLGIAPYLVGATVEAVLSQRLVRRICSNCRIEYEPSPEIVAAVTGQPIFSMRLTRGAGCSSCRGTGFKGRVGIFELLPMDEELKDAISRNALRAEMRDIAHANGLLPLRLDGWRQAKAGVTTVEEVFRVAQE
jgi:type II secretory ATPase GspE/PulE/Tfp pilus assembly ATPase PilB-like protein